MKKYMFFVAVTAFSLSAQAGSIRGALGNFDAINESGQITYGIEIEIDDLHAKDVFGTYPGNHYGTGVIREDLTDPLHPKVFVHYERPKVSGLQTGFTSVPVGIPASCYNLTVNVGCEHFGVHISTNTYTTVKYNWLIKDTSGKVVVGPALNLGAPVVIYTPPVVGFSAAQSVATIPAPVAPQPIPKQFGEPSWVKVIKTTAHKTQPLVLGDLVSADNNNDNLPDWTNGETPEVESEWFLLQSDSLGKTAKSELKGQADNMGANGDEAVTRRYEFYAYTGPTASFDGETGEAMCDAVAADNVSGSGTVSVTDIFGNSQSFDCSSVAVVGNFRGAQMTEFVALTPFSMADTLQDGNVAASYPYRPLLTGGNTPYVTTISNGSLPTGLTVNSTTGLVSGTPSKVGVFNFIASGSDADGTMASKTYKIKVTGPGDTDADNDIDSADLNNIKAKYGQFVAAKDPADLNGDLRVNMADYRKAISLCTLPQCVLITPAP
jgi:hypothetical protein